MRVSEGRARPAENGQRERTRRFGDALRSAGRDGKRARQGGEALGAETPVASRRAATSRRTAADRTDDALRDRRDGFREEARAAGPPPESAARPAEPASAPELTALVRTLPLAVQTFGLREGAPLALSFGRSLDVELRAVPGGVELILRPEARLARAAAAELPRVVSALAAKGIAVARAGVRARPAGAAAATCARVDLPPGVR